MSAFSSLRPTLFIALLLVIAPFAARADDAQPVQQTVYSGAGHGFDADPNNADARDATARAVGFFVQMLK